MSSSSFLASSTPIARYLSTPPIGTTSVGRLAQYLADGPPVRWANPMSVPGRYPQYARRPTLAQYWGKRREYHALRSVPGIALARR
eukprot:1394067-Rhodomonas_salina.1